MVALSWICSECSLKNEQGVYQCVGCKKRTNPQQLRSMSGSSLPNMSRKEQDIYDQLVQFGYTKSDISRAMSRSLNPLDINEVIEHIKQPNAPYTVCTVHVSYTFRSLHHLSWIMRDDLHVDITFVRCKYSIDCG